MGDRIRLKGIEVLGRHGVYTAEKFSDQPFVVDLDCVLDRERPVDVLSTTVDYSELAERVAGIVQAESVDLIETLAHRIAEMCLAIPVVTKVTVTVHKPEAPIGVPVRDVAVRVKRRKERP
ncbi:MAG: dihydroneopterin aldolase [Propionicimonas sp.]